MAVNDFQEVGDISGDNAMTIVDNAREPAVKVRLECIYDGAVCHVFSSTYHLRSPGDFAQTGHAVAGYRWLNLAFEDGLEGYYASHVFIRNTEHLADISPVCVL